MKLYNTLTRTKEEFVPIEEGKVKMYVCGPTVYNYIHIGNARPFIIFDTLRRYLEYRGYDVTFVQNFTDVDDKIIKRGHEEQISPEEVANKYINEYFVDADGLGIKRVTRTKEEFVPIEEGKVKMYVCGPTVYNYIHIGNARPFIIFDTLRRYLEYRGYDVTFVQNFTDVDDKIIKRGHEEQISPEEVANKYINEYFVDADGLGIKRASVHPRVTDNINEIIKFVKELEDKGYAYEVNGDVYFDTKKFEGYGKLSKQNQDDLEAGARIEVNSQKRHPMDFVLWKSKKEGEPGWQSPWGEGRPGWHIECSVMSNRYLGETIDIHAGGQDLAFPHHENEIAQSEARSGKPFSNYWVHNGYININNEKMSKSKGNFFTVRDISKSYDLEIVRFFMLSSHYRNPVNFSDELLSQSKSGLERLYNAKERAEFIISNLQESSITDEESSLLEELNSYRTKFINAM